MKDRIIAMNKITLILLCFFLSVTHAQDNRLVNGTVTTSSGTPIQGATVLVKGTFVETVTDVEGVFQIDAKGNDTLLVSAFGMYSREVPVDSFNLPAIQLAPVSEELGEVEINQKRTYEDKNVIGGSAIRRALGFDGDRFREYFVKESDPSVYNSIANMTGVELVAQMDASMSDQVFGRYLGISRFRSGGSPPPPATIIIDDVVATHQEVLGLSPDMIENVMIVKDGSRLRTYCYIYGKCSGGVIQIDTIYGKMGPEDKGVPSLLVDGNDYENDAIAMDQALVKPDYIIELEKATSFEEARSIHQAQIDAMNSASLPFFLDTAQFFRKLE